MQPHRLSYGTAGTAIQPRSEAPRLGRQGSQARVPAGLEAPLLYGARSPTPSRRRRVVIATLVVAHGVAVLGLLDAGRLRDSVDEVRPVFLAVVEAPVAPTAARPLPLPPRLEPPLPQPVQLPLIAPEPAPSSSTLLAVADRPPPAPAMPATLADAAEPAAAAVAAPRVIPAAAVQFLVPPAPVYSRLSARLRESGKALVRVFIDEAGLPRNVQIAASTGYARLDDAALVAVRNARFRPCVENGVAVGGWASIPIEFELPK